jgi:hypothetical protein
VLRALAGYRPNVTGSADTSFRQITTNPATTVNGDSNPRCQRAIEEARAFPRAACAETVRNEIQKSCPVGRRSNVNGIGRRLGRPGAEPEKIERARVQLAKGIGIAETARLTWHRHGSPPQTRDGRGYVIDCGVEQRPANGTAPTWRCLSVGP